MQRITFPSSALRRASSLTRACLRAIRTGLSTLLDMGRYTGVGMPRAKKAKPAPAPAPPPAPPTPAQPPDPPPTPPKLTRIVAPESPSRTLLLRAQRLARITAKKKAAESRKLLTEHQQAYEVAGRLFDSKLKRIETESHAKNPSRKFSAARAAARIDKATAELSEARYTLLGAVLLACEADGEVLLAQSACKDAKIARLRRQLRVAQRTRRKRCGWSTTRVRFSL